MCQTNPSYERYCRLCLKPMHQQMDTGFLYLDRFLACQDCRDQIAGSCRVFYTRGIRIWTVYHETEKMKEWLDQYRRLQDTALIQALSQRLPVIFWLYLKTRFLVVLPESETCTRQFTVHSLVRFLRVYRLKAYEPFYIQAGSVCKKQLSFYPEEKGKSLVIWNPADMDRALEMAVRYSIAEIVIIAAPANWEKSQIQSWISEYLLKIQSLLYSKWKE